MATEAKQRFGLGIERTIRAKRARVFEAFTNPDDLAQWSAPEGLSVTDGSVDLRVVRQGHEQGWTSCFDKLERMFA